jgi:predicted Zn-dependent protease with MMP-like domain
MRRLTIAALVRQAIAEVLNEPLRAQLARVLLTVKWSADEQDTARGAREDLRGYYYAEEAPAQACSPFDQPEDVTFLVRRPEIVLFARNIAPDLEAVATVLLHELGHHLGVSEAELVEAWGLG